MPWAAPAALTGACRVTFRRFRASLCRSDHRRHLRRCAVILDESSALLPINEPSFSDSLSFLLLSSPITSHGQKNYSYSLYYWIKPPAESTQVRCNLWL
jgi:hypothetical protein